MKIRRKMYLNVDQHRWTWSERERKRNENAEKDGR